MNLLRALARLPSAERVLFARTVLLVATIRLALWIVPFTSLRRLLDGHLHPCAAGTPHAAGRLAWAVQAASRRIPGASCLTQSLALHWLLVRAGCASRLRIGVSKDAQSRFQAHAWVEHGGRPWLSSPSEVALYTHLLDLEEGA